MSSTRLGPQHRHDGEKEEWERTTAAASTAGSVRTVGSLPTAFTAFFFSNFLGFKLAPAGLSRRGG